MSCVTIDVSLIVFFCSCYCDHRDLHGLTHAAPTRRSTDLLATQGSAGADHRRSSQALHRTVRRTDRGTAQCPTRRWHHRRHSSEEHTSELQATTSITYAVLCLKHKTTKQSI